MTIYSGFSHWKWWFSIARLNYQRVQWNPLKLKSTCERNQICQVFHCVLVGVLFSIFGVFSTIKKKVSEQFPYYNPIIYGTSPVTRGYMSHRPHIATCVNSPFFYTTPTGPLPLPESPSPRYSPRSSNAQGRSMRAASSIARCPSCSSKRRLYSFIVSAWPWRGG